MTTELHTYYLVSRILEIEDTQNKAADSGIFKLEKANVIVIFHEIQWELHIADLRRIAPRLSPSKCHAKTFFIHDRIRTCNLSVRSRTRYPLRHTDGI